MKLSRETIALAGLTVLGLATRLITISRFPTIPFSDFNALVAFGGYFNTQGIIPSGNAWFWDFFNPGLPLILCGLFKLYPCVDPGSVSRIATAMTCGLLPLVPFLFWRGVLNFPVRLLAGAALALWPGQVFFSGVVSQDNWVLLPTVALGALAVRVLQPGERGRPLAAGLLYAAAVVMRQEMLVVMFPAFLAASRFYPRVKWRTAMVACLAAGLPLVGMAAYRYACTGRFAISTQHTGSSILGSYIPGAVVNGWTDVYPFIASVKPELLHDRRAVFANSAQLAIHEALRRPAFHAARIVAATSIFAISGEAASMYWSVGAPEVLPVARRARGAALAQSLHTPLEWELAIIQTLFLAALLIGIRRRNPAILVLSTAVLLKYFLHAVTVPQGRYYLPATALEILAIAVAVYEISSLAPHLRRRLVLPSLLAAAVFIAVLALGGPRMQAAVEEHDVDFQRSYQFWINAPDSQAQLACRLDQGLLVSLNDFGLNSTIRTEQHDPSPGESAVAKCELTAQGDRPVWLEVLDDYPTGGLPDRMLQRVEVDGVEVFSHDLAREPGIGWARVPLGVVGKAGKKSVQIEIRAVHPDPGAKWGDAAKTEFQLARPE